MLTLRQIFKVAATSSKPAFASSTAKIHKYELKGESSGWVSTGKNQAGIEMSTDLPQKVGGKGLAPTPIDLVLQGLIGCEFITGQAIAKQLGFELKKTKYQITGERDDRGLQFKPWDKEAPVTSALQKITGTIYVETNGTQEQLDSLEKVLRRRCPVARMVLDSGCKIEVEWKKVDTIPE